MKKSLYLLKVLVTTLAIFTFTDLANAQKGYPYVSSFSFIETLDNDNFDLIQDNNLNILIANRKGILTFDSRNWDLLPLTYFPVVLVKSSIDGSVYAGCRNGFGLLQQDVTGKYNYKLLSDTVFTGEISEIELTSAKHFFIARNRIYHCPENNTGIKCWEFPYEHFVSGSFVFRDEFYFLINGQGLYKAASDSFNLISDDHFSKDNEIIFAVKTDSGEVLIGTAENECYLFDGSGFTQVSIQNSEYLKTSVITDGAYLGNNEVAVGSLMGGVMIFNYKTGQTSSILNYKTGLPDDEIFCLSTDINQGLWLCHSFGMSRIDNRLNVSNLTWYPGLSGNLTNSVYFNGQLYVGTSEGLYSLKETRKYSEKLVFEKPIPAPAKIETPLAITTTTVNNEPANSITGSNNPDQKETLTKKELRKRRRETRAGITKEQQAESAPQPGFIDRILNTVQNPSRIFEKKANNEEYSLTKKKVYSLQSISHSYEQIPGIKGKCTEILVIKDHLLVSSYNGLYDIYRNQVNSVLPETYISFLNPGPDDKTLFAGSGKSIFILKRNGERWEVAREFDALDYPVYSACMTSQSELWLGSDNSAHKLTIDGDFYAEKDESFPINTKFSDKVILRYINQQLYFLMSSGIFRFENNEIKPVKTFDKLTDLPSYYFSDNKVVWYRTAGRWDFLADNQTGINLPNEYLNIFKTVQDIYLGDKGDLFIIANNQEIFHINKAEENTLSDDFSVFFSRLKGTNDALFPLIRPKISYKKSSLRIEFSAPYYIAPEKTEFAYMIKGLNSEWSPWSDIARIEYPLLPPGEYSVKAKARNIFGKESEISSLDIIVRPPFWRTTVFYIFMVILVFTLFGFFVRIREKSLQNAKLILEQKVIERTAEIERQKDEISEQKKEITDSIFYAKRIQTAVLPSTVMLSSVLSEHFVLFLPKDIVSGDFYWSVVKGDKIVILAADCTGHGVPGAFMSMLGISFLNEIVNSHPLDNAGSVLNELREHVKATLAQSGDSVHARDGMDIALCIIDQKQMKLQFAGAYNPLYMIRENELTEIKGDKMPIGWYELTAGFANNVINISKGDCFYLFSDGFIDQFGGPFEKKFLSKPFKKLLVKIHPQPLSKQKDMLFKTFEDWKGKLQQVDDVLIIGFRI